MNNESQIVLYQPDDSIRLEVKIDAGNETVWLNRNQIAELFGRDVKTIGKHINNALREELATETETNVSDVNNPNNPTVAKFATVQIEGGREVTRQVEYYNLDVILSVGYRVKSNRGIQFRRWSNTILKQYLLQGYSINRHLVALQERTDQRFADIEQRRLTLIRHSRTTQSRSRGNHLCRAHWQRTAIIAADSPHSERANGSSGRNQPESPRPFSYHR